MKYLYFDCFAGFDVFMALGAVADMLGCKNAKEMVDAINLRLSNIRI